jgi:hypothetical protein
MVKEVMGVFRLLKKANTGRAAFRCCLLLWIVDRVFSLRATAYEGG